MVSFKSKETFERVAMLAFGSVWMAVVPGSPDAMLPAFVGVAGLFGVIANEFAKAGPESRRRLDAIRRRVREKVETEYGTLKSQFEIDDADKALSATLLQCFLDREALAQAAADPLGFPTKATQIVLDALAASRPDAFGPNAPAVGIDYARAVVSAALLAAIDDRDYFEKIESRLAFAHSRDIARLLELNGLIEERLDGVKGDTAASLAILKQIVARDGLSDRTGQTNAAESENQTLSRLKSTADLDRSQSKRSHAIKMIGLRGGQPEILWFADFVLRAKWKATRRDAIHQIAALGGPEAIRALKSIAESSINDHIRVEAVELVPKLDRLSDPDWLINFLRSERIDWLRNRFLGAIASEGWSNRLDMNVVSVRSFVHKLRDMTELESHPDVRQTMIAIVAHLCRDEPWTREWVWQRAIEADEGYYRTRCYAAGLSAWNNDEAFVQALNNSPTDSPGANGADFARWAGESDWKSFYLHMGGWGPKG